MVPHSPQTLVPSSPGTTFSGPKAPAAHPTWCCGASHPASPCSFVAGHHVFEARGAGGAPGVVLLSPQTLVPPSPGTTSSESKAPAAHTTWCLTPRKPLFLRRRAPRLRCPRRRQLAGRGASLPANPCSSVVGHHVFRVQGAGGTPGVVPHSPQTLVPSSPGTTSSGPKAPAAHPTWCLTPRKPLFLRRRAPRFRGPRRRRRTRRGASLPANPCSFVAGHHVFGAQSAGSAPDVVPHSPQTLVPSSPGTTSSRPDGFLADAKKRSPEGNRLFLFLLLSRNSYFQKSVSCFRSISAATKCGSFPSAFCFR